MWTGISVFFLAFAVSLDSFGVGVTYGLRNIRIPFLSIVVISCFSGGMILLSMFLGHGIATWLSPIAAKQIGAGILIGIGLWSLWQVRKHSIVEEGVKSREKSDLHQSQSYPVKVFRIQIKALGLVIQILKTPIVADQDRSGTISPSEAVLLGTALSLDAFGAGLGASLLGYAPVLTVLLIAGMGGLLLLLGMKAGFRFSRLPWMGSFSFFPGILLMTIGLLRLIG